MAEDNTHKDKEALELELQIAQTRMADLAHDLRGPLHNILSLLYARRHTEDKRECNYLYMRARNEVYRARRIVDNVLASSLRSTLIHRRYVQAIDVVDLCRKCLSEFKYLAARRGIGIKLVPPACELMIEADPGALHIAIVNVIDNAVKYAYSGTVIEMMIKVETHNVNLICTDTGVGIPKNQIQHICDQYF